MATGSFLCLCPVKSVETGEDNKLHRAENLDKVREELDRVDFGGKDKMVICLPGGGVAAEGMGTHPEIAVDGSFLAVLSGTIENYSYIIRKYFIDELGYPRNVSLETIRQASPIRDAALLCKLYERLGTGMLTKLRGQFAFCLYDSSTIRVLAARDPSGEVPLHQGQTRDGWMFISCGPYRPDGALNVVEIQPGKYKYGWRAPPRKYANPKDCVDQTATDAAKAAIDALKGIKVPKGMEKKHKEWKAFENNAQGPPKLRTREGIREWSAQIAKDAMESYEKAVESGEITRLWSANQMGGRRQGRFRGREQNQGRQWWKPKGPTTEEMRQAMENSKFKPNVLAALFQLPQPKKAGSAKVCDGSVGDSHETDSSHGERSSVSTHGHSESPKAASPTSVTTDDSPEKFDNPKNESGDKMPETCRGAGQVVASPIAV